MLYVCAGMEKGGTTYTYNLTKLLLAEAGYPYIHLSKELRGDKAGKEHPANNLKEWSPEIVENLRANDPGDGQIVALRTHNFAYAPLVDLLRSTGGKSHIAIRDPRDMALSLMDVSAKRIALEKVNRASIVLGDFTTTFEKIQVNIDAVTSWRNETDCLVLYYEDTAFSPSISIAAMCKQLSLEVPEDRFESLAATAAANPSGKLNVGMPMRHRREMSPQTQQLFLDRFADFYAQFFPNAVVEAEDGAGEQERDMPTRDSIMQAKRAARIRAREQRSAD